jgi:hypothetical protein
VNAREFNSLALNLYPILQAAAHGSDQFGGSVAKLRQEIISGNVSSKIFFDAIIAGSGDLEERASKATLTTAQGFTSLTNALVVYFGEADKAQGVSAALGSALQKLGDNLDTIIPAIAAIGTALTVGYITRMAAAAIATQGLGTAILGAFGGTVGLAITAVTLAIAGTVIAANDASAAARDAADGLKALQDKYGDAGKAAGAASSGVRNVGTDALGAIPHVNAFAGAVGNLADQLYRQARAARAAQIETLTSQKAEVDRKRDEALSKLPEGEQMRMARVRPGDYLGAVSAFGSTMYERSVNALHGGYTDLDNRAAYNGYVSQSGILGRQIAQLSNLKTNPISSSDLPEGAGGSTLSPKNAKALATLQDKLDGLEKLAGTASGARLDRINSQIDITKRKIADIQAGANAAAASAAEGGGGSRRGPSADTLARRAEAERQKAVRDQRQYDADLRKAQLDYLQQQADLADDGAKRADLERQRVRFAAEQYAKEIAAQGPASAGGTGKYTAEQVATLQRLNADTANLRVQSIDQAEGVRLAKEARSIDAASVDLWKQELQAREGFADTLAQRRDLAQQLLDLEFQEREKALKAARDDESAPTSQREIARAQLAALPTQRSQAQEALDRNNEGIGRQYARSLGTDRQQIVEGTEVKILQDFNGELDKTVSKALNLHGIFGEIVDDLVQMAIKQALIAPVANALFPASGNGGGGVNGSGSSGFFGNLISGIGSAFGRGEAQDRRSPASWAAPTRSLATAWPIGAFQAPAPLVDL